MTTLFRAPKLSANVDEATVTAWFKAEGDAVQSGEALVELTTDKTAFEVEAPCDGTLLKMVATIKSVVPVGYILAAIGDTADTVPDTIESENEACMAAHREASGTQRRRRKAAGGGRERRQLVRATPAARRLARELGVDLAAVQAATGADAVDEEMVQAHADSA